MDRSVLVATKVGVAAQRLRDKWQLLSAAFREPETLGTVANDLMARELLEQLCSADDVFLDVGAHIGSVIDGVQRNSNPAAIIAVEAIPEKARNLRSKFPAITVHSCAVGEEDGDVSFFIDDQQSGYSSLFSEGKSSNLRQLTVPLRMLDTLIPTNSVNVMKIDVEGAELGVLRGGQKLIARAQPLIMFESGPAEEGGYTKQGLWHWFEDAGYEILVPNRLAHLGYGLNSEGFAESHLYPRRTTNYFAVPRTRREEIRSHARVILGFST